MKFIKKNKYLLLTIFVALLMISIIFWLKGIYPFGSKEFNIIDFDSAYVPVYYKLWDILHGKGSIFFDWNLGSGLNCFGSLIMNSLLLPTSTIIGITSRNMIPFNMSYVLILKLLTITICAYIAIDQLFPNLKNSYKMIFTLFYTFSGWTTLMLSSLIYLDVVALFPLFVLAYYKLMKENKWVMYLIILSLALILNYYMAWMYLFFIFGITIISALTLDIKDKKEKCVKVLLLTLLSLGISAICFLPSFSQTLTSYRMANAYANNDVGFTLFSNKIIHILPLGILFALTLKQLFQNYKEDKKINLWIILMLVYSLIGIIVEPINLLWHTGSYSDLPFRYSYIPTFILIIASAYYCNKNKNANKYNLCNMLCSIILIIMFVVFVFIFKDEMSYGQIALHVLKYSQTIGLIFLFFIAFLTTFIILKNDLKTTTILLSIFSIINLFSFTYMYINNKPNTNNSIKTQELATNFKLKKDNYNYVDLTNNLNINFPYILEIPSMENRLHFVKEEEINYRDAFGYPNAGTTIISSSGGNLFSNLLLQNKYYFSKNPLNEKLYNLIDYKDDIYYYESKYNMNYLIPYSGEIYNQKSDDIFNNTNMLYQKLFQKTDNILEKDEYQKMDNNFLLDLKKDNIYYIIIKDAYTKEYEFNDKIYIEYFYFDTENAYLSFYVKEDKEITLKTDNIEEIKLGHINIEKYINFVNSINTLKNVKVETIKNKRIYNLESDTDTNILIPINYDNNILIKVNNKPVTYELNAYNMFSINISKGTNTIEIEYIPKYLKEGTMISTLSIILLLITILLNKKFHFLKHKILLNILFYITLFIGILFILKVYILSWIHL